MLNLLLQFINYVHVWLLIIIYMHISFDPAYVNLPSCYPKTVSCHQHLCESAWSLQHSSETVLRIGSQCSRDLQGEL